ncbi:MAG: thiamine-phosphate kinase [Burkholderiaceae bacterium]|nr:thiamine-phosphate kinase [Burkholderiaceae bacterium]
MALGEFSLIDRYFKRSGNVGSTPGTIGVGDDAAILPMPPGHKLVACKDVLIEGRHFFTGVVPDSLSHKSLAVNLSDLAAMGAKPIGCLLGLGIPSVDEAWLASFSGGLNALAERWGCPLVGGDTVATKDGIVISVTALGILPYHESGLLRSAAKVDDDIWVSGPLGAPDIALQILAGNLEDPQGCLPKLRPTLERPEPRVALGQRLLGFAHAAIDISDGLTQDLSHVLDASHVGAVLTLKDLPVHDGLAAFDPSAIQRAVLHGGDVYELCFTAPAVHRQRIGLIGQSLGLQLSRVGKIRAEPGLFANIDDSLIEIEPKGFDHFLRGEQ